MIAQSVVAKVLQPPLPLRYVVMVIAEDGPFDREFDSFREANAYLEELTGTTLANYWDYAYGGMADIDRFERAINMGSPKWVIDNWGRRAGIALLSV